MDELAVFGLPACIFLLYQYHYTVSWATEYHVLPNMMHMWLMLVFIYALFIPNAWQRAAVFLSSMAVAPLAMTVYLALLHPEAAAARNSGVTVHRAIRPDDVDVGDFRYDWCPHHRTFAPGSV